MAKVWKTPTMINENAVEITREATRGAMHVVDEKPLSVDDIIEPVASGIVEASRNAGIQPMNGIKGVSQGIIQGAAETGIDLSEATQRILKAARKIAEEMGVSEEEAVIQAAEGVLTAAEEIGPEAVAEVVDDLPDEVFPKHDTKQNISNSP
jgi:hypothetical protein